MTGHPPPGVPERSRLGLAAFPVTYAVHVAEEFWGGESFPVWASRVSGTVLSNREFLVLNGVAFAVMCLVVVLAGRTARLRWATAALGTVTAVNGTLHLLGSAITGSYSPGAVSGVLLWLPLGWVALRQAYSELPRPLFIRGCAVGCAGHALVTTLAFVF